MRNLRVMSSLVEQLYSSPTLPEELEELSRMLTEERGRRLEFYADITPEHKWEFINGQVILHSPALNRHLFACKRLMRMLDSFVATNRLGVVHTEKAMCSFPRNDYEPDIVFFGSAKAGVFGPDTLRFPVPDFIVEILSPSTEERDRGIKMRDYAFHGVGEYWIVDPEAETVEQHFLAGDTYPAAPRRSDGALMSKAVAGFEIPVRAIFDEAENLRALKNLLDPLGNL